MNVSELLASFESKRILVVGDCIVDITTHLERIKDDDTGNPTYRTILDERGKADQYSIGGAGLVVRNLLELGAKVDWITAIGYGAGALFAQTFNHKNLTKHAVQVSKPQTVKHRFKCNGEKVLQVDTVDNAPLEWVDETSLWIKWDMLVDLFSKSHDAIVVADYRHGLISEKTAERTVKSRFHEVPLYVSSQVAQSGSNHHWYRGATIIANQREKDSNPMFRYITKNYVFTHGERGASHDSGRTLNIRTAIDVDVVDACGAGDAFLAAYCLTNDLKFANTWAGLSVTIEDANPPTLKMLRDWYAKDAPTGKYEDMAFCG
jgi:bifunctional ADP-heptose synthase (sugar kinase/adenylyltransferase)